MKKKLLALLLALVLLALPVSASASDSGSRTFYAASCTLDDREYNVSSEYVVLDPDGTGMVVYRGCAYRLDWASDGAGGLNFYDSKDNSFFGVLESDGTLHGTFHGLDYVYQAGGDAPITALSPDTWGKGLPPVTDQAKLLSGADRERLAQRAGAIAEQHGCGVYIALIDDLRNFSLSHSVETCAEEIRTGYDLGVGSERNCILLLLSMAERDYDLVAFGDSANRSFTDYGKEYIADGFLDNFRRNDWTGGLEDYLSGCEELLRAAEQGAPVDVGNRPVNKAAAAILSLLAGFLPALIVCLLLKSGMKSTKAQTSAGNYVPAGGLNITYRHDRYTHTTESRVYDPPSKSSGGGGGTHTSSSGHSHSSGKF